MSFAIFQVTINGVETLPKAKTMIPKRNVPAPGPYKRISDTDAKAMRMHYGCVGGGQTAPVQK